MDGGSEDIYQYGELATPKTYLESLEGGLLIGVAASIFLFFSGQRAGLSGIYSGECSTNKTMKRVEIVCADLKGCICGLKGVIARYLSDTTMPTPIRWLIILDSIHQP